MENNEQENTPNKEAPNISNSAVGVKDASVQISERNKKPYQHKPVIILAFFCFLLYPLLETVATCIDVITGRSTTTNGMGWVPFHTFSEPAMYIYIYGLTAAVALSFIYLMIQTWKESHSTLRVLFLFIGGVIVTACACTGFSLSIAFIGGLIHLILGK